MRGPDGQAPDSRDALTHELASADAAPRIDALLRSADEAFFQVDLATETIVWSPAVRLVLGHDPERIGPRLADWQALVRPDELAALNASGHDAVAGGAPAWSGEFRLARADGSYATVRARSLIVRSGERPAWVVGSLADLTPLRTLEEELDTAIAELGDELERERRERERAELLMRSSMSEALGEWDLRSDAITWSPNVAEVLGYPTSELGTMRDVVRHSPSGEGERAADEARRAVAEGRHGWSGRFAWLAPSGERVTAEVNSYVLRDASGAPERLIGSIRILPEGARQESAAPPVPALTERQREVLRLVRLGRTNKEIAERFGISEQGAKTIVSRLLRKFGVANRAALAAVPEHDDAPPG